MIMYFL